MFITLYQSHFGFSTGKNNIRRRIMYRFLLDIADPNPIRYGSSTSGMIAIVVGAVLLLALVGVAAYFIVKKIKKDK